MLPDGRLAIRMKGPLADGRQELQLEPVELLRGLATLVPPPRAHLVRITRSLRSGLEVAQQDRTGGAPRAPARASRTGTDSFGPSQTGRGRARGRALEATPTVKIPWAELPQRVFREDVLACPCGGRRRVIAFITERAVVKAILEHLGLPTIEPPFAPAPERPRRTWRSGKTTCSRCSMRSAEGRAGPACVPALFPT